MTFSLVLWYELADEINRQPGKIRRIIKPALERLKEDPFPGSKGDKDKLVLKGGVIICQLHISARYTAFFYEIDKEDPLEKKLVYPLFSPIGKI